MNKDTTRDLTLPSRERVLHLLAEAAELEHNLLCSYLFAAFSLKQSEAEDLRPHEWEAVQRWRKTLMGVCVEEMAHLAQVCNLMAALGARPHLNRPNLPVAPGYHPAGIEVFLAPFDRDTVTHFVYLERSDEAAVPDATDAGAGSSVDRPPPTDELTPSAPHYETIGEFYAAVRQALTAFCDRVGPERAFLQGARQLDAAESGIDSLKVVSDLRSALDAIDQIVEQGEGGRGVHDDSHFARFTETLQELQALQAARPAFVPARAVGRHPVMRPPQADDRTHVVAPAARALLDFANASYWLMLRCLGQLYETPAAQGEARRALYEVMLGCMHLLAASGSRLTTLAADDADGPRAGCTFTMMRSTEGYAAGAAALPLIAERLDELRSALQRVDLGAAERERMDGTLASMARALTEASKTAA